VTEVSLTENDKLVKTLPSPQRVGGAHLADQLAHFSNGTVGRPSLGRDFQRQYNRKPARCQPRAMPTQYASIIVSARNYELIAHRIKPAQNGYAGSRQNP
jgi:hypothetical protein